MRTPTPPKSPTTSALRPPGHAALSRPDECPSIVEQIAAQLFDHVDLQPLLDQYRDWAENCALHDRNAAIAREEERLRQYIRQGDLLRQIHLQRRQEQYCERCGYRFNYKADGNLKYENDWCRSDKRSCDTSNGQPSCLGRRKTQKAAIRREHRKGPTSTNTQGPVTIAPHSNGTPQHH